MKALVINLLMCIIGFNCAAQGTVIRVDNFKSKFVKPRNIDIWLPPGYSENKSDLYPVLYINDGQNVFDPSASASGISLDVHTTAAKLVNDGLSMPFIIVAIWNTDQRFYEYFPEKAAQYLTRQDQEEIEHVWNGKKAAKTDYLADEYLKFITAELKPFIDKNYRTQPDAATTSIAGTAMGGLLSLYAVSEYPKVFGQAAGISTHWPILLNNDNMSPSDAVRKYFEEHIPAAGTHRFYFDHGTNMLDQGYGVHQNMIDHIMTAKGYIKGTDWVTHQFEGADQSEKYIKEHMDTVLQFLFPPKVE